MTTEQFNKLSKKDKKILVAVDVLEQLKIGKYIPERGTYINLWDIMSFDIKDDIKNNFDKINTCNVCALGSCILSITKFANKLNFGDIRQAIGAKLNEDETELIKSSNKINKILLSVFSEKELALMEASFEGIGNNNFSSNKFDYKLNEEEKLLCDEFFLANGGEYVDEDEGFEVNEMYTLDNQLLENIMKNIIKNGAFKP